MGVWETARAACKAERREIAAAMVAATFIPFADRPRVTTQAIKLQRGKINSGRIKTLVHKKFTGTQETSSLLSILIYRH